MGVKYQLIPEGTIWLPGLKSLAQPEKRGFAPQDIVLQTCHTKIPILTQARTPTVPY